MKTKLMILIMMLALASLYTADTLYSGMNDKTDRLSGEQSGVFSPGYVNAAMQKTREIINQSNQYNSPIENTTELAKDKLSDKVMEDSANKVMPELKKKTSATGETNKQTSSTNEANLQQLVSSGDQTVVIQNANSGEIPVSVRDKVQEYADKNGITYLNSDGSIKSAGGKYYALWSDNNSIKAQIFDQDGKALLTTPANATTNKALTTADIDNITTLANGNLAVFWSDKQWNSWYCGSAYAQIFDQEGKALDAPINFTNGTGSSIKTTTLANGNLAVYWNDYDPSSNYNYASAKVQIFNQSGKALAAPINVTTGTTLTKVAIQNVATLENGNLAVFWSENHSNSAASVNAQIKVQTFDKNDGHQLLTSPITLTTNTTLTAVSVYDVTTLANGNLAVFWREDSSSSAKAQILDKNDGHQLLASPINFTGAGHSNAAFDNITTLENGNLAVFWVEYNSSNDKFLKAQILDKNGTPLAAPSNFATWYSTASSTKYINNVTTLANGDLAVFWSQVTFDSSFHTSVKAQILDKNGKTVLPASINLTTNTTVTTIKDITALENGSLAIFWTELDSSYHASIKGQIFDQNGKALLTVPINFAGSVSNVTTLANGDLAVFWGETDSSNHMSVKVQIFDQNGRALLITPVTVTSNASLSAVSIDNITMLSNGDIAVFLRGSDSTNGRVSYETQILSADGDLKPITVLRSPAPETSFGDFGNSILANKVQMSDLNNLNIRSLAQDIISQSFFEISNINKSIGNDAVAGIFKGLLANKESLSQNAAGPINPAILAKILRDALIESALSVPVGEISPQEMRIAMLLANIIKNPTDEQKMILDTATALLKTVNDIEGSDSPELKKASDDLLQVMASVLMAQAMPDLFREGDVANIKSIFAELGNIKGRIMLEYQESTKPYYDQMVKELSKNMSILQLKNILSGSMTKDELAKIPPNELDKILEKLRQAKDKSFEEEYIIQQEAKYRKQYIYPNKKMLEEKMKEMMKRFTEKLSRVLEGVKPQTK